jgi:hypothetical protein
MRDKIKKKLRSFFKNTDGSETTEMLATSMMIVIFIMVGFMFFTYIFEVNLCATALRRVVRDVEEEGYVDQTRMLTLFTNGTGGSNNVLSNRAISANYQAISGTNKIKWEAYGTGMRPTTFTVEATATYHIPLLTSFTLDFPIKVTASGVSEVYWTSSSGYGSTSRK